MAELEKFVESQFEVPALQAYIEAPHTDVDRGAMIEDTFAHIQAARRGVRSLAEEHGLLANPAGDDYLLDQRLARLAIGTEVMTLRKLSAAVAGARLLVTNIDDRPGYTGLLDSRAVPLSVPVIARAPRDPRRLASPHNRDSFRLFAHETNEQLIVIPFNTDGQRLVTIHELPTERQAA